MHALKAGRRGEAAAYTRQAGLVWEAVMVGNHAMLEVLQDEAGQSRAGYHGRQVAGRTTGRYVAAPDWVIASFRQHTSRSGDPQLHVHNLVLNRVLTEDGVWRTLDSTKVHQIRAWAAAVGERAMEEHLTRTLGVAWQGRPDGHGREIVGVDPALMELFSSRRVQIRGAIQGVVEAYEARYGKPPNPRALFSMAQHVTKATKARKRKSAECPTRTEMLDAWERQSRQVEESSLADVPPRALSRLSPRGLAATRARGLDPFDIEAVLMTAVADVQASRAVWDRSQLIAAISRHLPDSLGGLNSGQVRRLLEDLAEQALAPSRGVRRVNAPPVAPVPPQLRRADGTSVYGPRHADRYTTDQQLDHEASVLAAAQTTGAPRMAEPAAASLLGARATPEPLVSGQPSRGRSLDQAAAVYGVLTSGRQVDVIVGPAGVGKSRTMGTLAELWQRYLGGRVVGLSTSQNAAFALGDQGLDQTANIDLFLTRLRHGLAHVKPSDLLIVDEASMVSTAHLHRLCRLAQMAGAKLVLAGDPAQLRAPDAGGLLAQLVDEVGAYRLTEVHRLDADWERDASLRLRAGDIDALDEYDRRGRLEEGTREQMEDTAFRAWLADTLTGRESLLIAATNTQTRDLNQQARAALVDLGRIEADGVPLRDGTIVGVGDLIQARCNHRGITDRTGRWVANRDLLHVVARTPTGGLWVQRPSGSGGRWLLPADYVHRHVELAYACTAHAAQGSSVDTAHALIDDACYRELAYVMLTRGRHANIGYIITDHTNLADLRPAHDTSPKEPDEEPRDRFDMLTRVLERPGAQPTAWQELRAELDRPTHLGHLGPIWVDLVRHHRARTYDNRLQRLLGEDLYARSQADPARSALVRLLRSAELAGHDTEALLADAVAERPLNDPTSPADSIAKVLHHRISKRIGVPEPADPAATWVERTPPLGDPDIDAYAQALAAAMDDRTARLGELAADDPPAWALEHLGPVPDDPLDRAEWTRHAGIVAGYREQFHPAGDEHADARSDHDPLGPQPTLANPEAHAAWQAAHDALGRPHQDRDLAAATDGQLWAIRAAYQRQTRWALPDVAEQLCAAAISHRHHQNEAVRLAAAAANTRHAAERDPLEARARAQGHRADQVAARIQALTEINEVRAAWHTATQPLRDQAQRASDELRRRLSMCGANADLPPLHDTSHDGREIMDDANLREALQQAHHACRILAERQRQEAQPSTTEDQQPATPPTPVRRAAASFPTPPQPTHPGPGAAPRPPRQPSQLPRTTPRRSL